MRKPRKPSNKIIVFLSLHFGGEYFDKNGYYCFHPGKILNWFNRTVYKTKIFFILKRYDVIIFYYKTKIRLNGK